MWIDYPLSVYLRASYVILINTGLRQWKSKRLVCVLISVQIWLILDCLHISHDIWISSVGKIHCHSQIYASFRDFPRFCMITDQWLVLCDYYVKSAGSSVYCLMSNMSSNPRSLNQLNCFIALWYLVISIILPNPNLMSLIFLFVFLIMFVVTI